jgi:2-(3-amino-3-carboxypropyl)histidine synthase
MNYNLELEKAISQIKKTKANRVCIQLPDGLKPKAKEIQDKIRKEFDNNIEILIWAGSCFGACDTPNGLEKLKVDLLIQWGHSEWK